MNSINASVQDMGRVRKGVTLLMSNKLHSGENDFGCVSFEILWVTFKFSTAKVCVVGVYGPIEGDNKEKGEILERLRQGCR